MHFGVHRPPEMKGSQVTEGTTGSTVPRRQLGRYLRDLRNQARMTIRTAAEQLEWSEAKMWRIETGQSSMRSLDAEAMCKVYGAPPDLTEALKALAKETKARGWWMSYGDVLPEGFDVYIGLEEAAAQLRGYESELVPGLLQTERYAHTLIERDNPGVDPTEIDRRVQVRLARQALLTRVARPLRIEVVLNEGILCRPVGGRKVMAQQLHHLVSMGSRDNVTIRVMPFRAGLHHGVMSGPFAVLDFPVNSNGQASEPPTVYLDSFTGALFLDKPAEVTRYDSAFADLRDRSLGEQESLTLMETAARKMEP